MTTNESFATSKRPGRRTALRTFALLIAAAIPSALAQPARAGDRLAARVARLKVKLDRLLTKQRRLESQLAKHANVKYRSDLLTHLLRADIKNVEKKLKEHLAVRGSAAGTAKKPMPRVTPTKFPDFFVSTEGHSFPAARRRAGRLRAGAAYAWVRIRHARSAVFDSSTYTLSLILRGSRRHRTRAAQVLAQTTGQSLGGTRTLALKLKRPTVPPGTYRLVARISYRGSAHTSSAAKAIYVSIPASFAIRPRRGDDRRNPVHHPPATENLPPVFLD
jgi:hypothetical protein